jgi:hypothetical protein
VDGCVVSSDMVRMRTKSLDTTHEMHGSRSKIRSKKSRPYIEDVKFLALLGAPYKSIYAKAKG